MSDKIVTLMFTNADVIPKTTKIVCSQSSVHGIMCWYGSHFKGHHYTVFCDGQNIPMNQYGEPLKALPICLYCAGTGMVLLDDGEPGICLACHGDTVAPGK